MYDVIICGAGPGGSFAAKILAEAGYDVILIEKESIPRDKPCGGWITPKVLSLLKISPSNFTCIQPIKGAVIWIKEKEKLQPYEIRYQKPVSYGIRRLEFDTLIVNQAKDLGAEVIDSTYVTRIIREKDTVLVQASKNQEFKGRFIIGADGTHSIVARDCGFRKKWKPLELTQCVVSETDIGEQGPNLTDYYGFPELFLNPKTMSYAWYFTKSTYLNIGLGIQMSKITPACNIKTLYDDFLKKLRTINHLKEVKLAPLNAHTYPVYYGPYHYPTYGRRVLLVGDAGGFPINYTGEGIRPALLSGKFAAETLIDALEFSRLNLRNYFLKWNQALRNEYITGDIFQMIFSAIDYELLKSVFLKDKRFRRLFFDLFFNLKNPRQVLPRFLLYNRLFFYRYLHFGFRKILERLIDFT